MRGKGAAMHRSTKSMLGQLARYKIAIMMRVEHSSYPQILPTHGVATTSLDLMYGHKQIDCTHHAISRYLISKDAVACGCKY